MFESRSDITRAPGPDCDAVKLNNQLPVTPVNPATSFMTQICRKNVAAVDFFSHQLRTRRVTPSYCLVRGEGGEGEVGGDLSKPELVTWNWRTGN